MWARVPLLGWGDINLKHLDVLIVALLTAWPIIYRELPDYWLLKNKLTSSGLFIFGFYILWWSYVEKNPVSFWKWFVNEELIGEKILLSGSPDGKTRKASRKWLVKARVKIWPSVLQDSLREWNSGSVAEGILSVVFDIIKKYRKIDDNDIINFLNIFKEKQIRAENCCELAAYLIKNKTSWNIIDNALFIVEDYLGSLKREKQIRTIIDIIEVNNSNILLRILNIIKQLKLFQERGIIRTLEQKINVVKKAKDEGLTDVSPKIEEILQESYIEEGKTIVDKDLAPSLSAGAII